MKKVDLLEAIAKRQEMFDEGLPDYLSEDNPIWKAAIRLSQLMDAAVIALPPSDDLPAGLYTLFEEEMWS